MQKNRIRAFLEEKEVNSADLSGFLMNSSFDAVPDLEKGKYDGCIMR